MTPKSDRMNAAHLRALRELYMVARRNGLSIAKASGKVASKARALRIENVRKYIRVIVEQVDGEQEEP